MAFLAHRGTLLMLGLALVLTGRLLAAEPALRLEPIKYPRLPYDLADIRGIDDVEFSARAKELLSQNGFVVVGPPHGNMGRCYRDTDMPFVTIDSVLEVFLSDFELAWGELEEKQAARFTEFHRQLWDALMERYASLPEGAAREAGQRLLGLTAVGRSLSDPTWQPPAQLPGDIDAAVLTASWKADLALARKADGVANSQLWSRRIDWSTFRPVGPYSVNPARQNYYRASQWWSRQGLRAAEDEERLAAGIVCWAMLDASPVDPSLSNERSGWRDVRRGPLGTLGQIESAYDQFFGKPVDLIVADLEHLDDNDDIHLPVDFGGKRFDRWLSDRFEWADELVAFREADVADATAERQFGKGFRLLPPRSTPATDVFSQVIAARVVDRPLPQAIDLIAALGNDRARELALTNTTTAASRTQLAKQLDKLRVELSQRDGWSGPRDFRTSHLRLLAALAHPRHDPRQPLFMGTAAYRDRGIVSALATWTGTREVYSVRVLGGGGLGGGKIPTGFAEPNLDAWQRLIELCYATDLAFKRCGVEFSSTAMDWSLVYRRIAEKQLRGESLTERETHRFLNYWSTLSNAIKIKADPNRHAAGIDRRVATVFAQFRMPDLVRYAGKSCCRLYAVVEFDGQLHLCQGGTFDYCEFDRPRGDVLTRTDFRELMNSDDAPKPPAWTSSYRTSE